MGSSKKTHDATRAERKAEKRKREDEVPDLPGDVEGAGEKAATKKKRKRDADADDLTDDKGRKEGNKVKEEKKRRKREAEEEAEGGFGEGMIVEEGGQMKRESRKEEGKKDGIEEGNGGVGAVGEAEEEAEAGPKKSKKERKAERRAAEAAEAAKSAAVPVTEAKPEGINGDLGMTEEATKAEREKKSKKNNRNREKKRKSDSASADTSGNNEKAEGKEKKDARFICFIGNLPFTATTSSITAHFAAVKPISVRALTQKDNPSKSKGIAFVEFEGYDHMKTCLKLFHHSLFDDGVSPARRINVELTAGGGGNTKGRRAKIQEKNHKLNEQRVRRMQEEEKAKLEKSSNAAAIDESAIHPSRRARVPGV